MTILYKTTHYVLFNVKRNIKGQCFMKCKIKRVTTCITLVVTVSTNVINLIYRNRYGILT